MSGDWISVDRPAPFGGDEAKCARQCGFRNSLLSPVAVDEEASESPVGRGHTQPVEAAHSARELVWGSELTPANDVRSVVDKGCVGPVRLNKSLLKLLVMPTPLFLLGALEVEGGAPAATPYTIVLLHNSHEVRPCLCSEFPDLIPRHELSFLLCVRLQAVPTWVAHKLNVRGVADLLLA